MALSIKEINGIFEVRGNLSSSNSFQVRKYFEIMLQMKKNIKISLAELDSMDIGSVLELQTLMVFAAKAGHSLSFTGESNKKIKGAFLGAGFDLFDRTAYRLTA